MVRGPLVVDRIGSTRRRWRMEVVACVVGVRVPIPPALPDAVRTHFLIVHGEIVVAIPADLEPSVGFGRIILAGEVDAKVESGFHDDPCGLGQSKADESRLEGF